MSGWLIHRLCRVESQLRFFQFCCWHSSTVVVMAGCDMNRSSGGGDVCIHCLVVSLRRRYRLNNDWFHTECPRCDSQLDNLTRYNYCQHKYGFKCYSRITWFCEVCIKCGEAFHLRDLSRIACYTCSWDNIKFAVLDDRRVSSQWENSLTNDIQSLHICDHGSYAVGLDFTNELGGNSWGYIPICTLLFETELVAYNMIV